MNIKITVPRIPIFLELHVLLAAPLKRAYLTGLALEFPIVKIRAQTTCAIMVKYNI